ncbi:hypothetical protein [Ahrensia sp. R2A130]|uniref:hypothetical protein n=1 Tax=Ahrensia sp. R2A130 TaxID=744979 RepID=UPI0001E0E09A|nr:hypothetical protein [Ahrensia sp. R2A130]EFL89318.1 hypothetical protein R2A130_3068 [Ahrensia sp. R2A130]
MILNIVIVILVGWMLLGVFAAINILRIIVPLIRKFEDTALPSNQTMMQKIKDSGQTKFFRKYTTLFAIAFAGLIATFPFLLVGKSMS